MHCVSAKQWRVRMDLFQLFHECVLMVDWRTKLASVCKYSAVVKVRKDSGVIPKLREWVVIGDILIYRRGCKKITTIKETV